MNKTLSTTLCAATLALGVAGLGLTGCESNYEPGVSSNYAQQWTTVNGDVEEATDAAVSAMEELDLKEVDSKVTSLDGQATGQKADGTKITIDVKPVTDDTSEVTARVGTTGDPELGARIVKMIEDELDDD